ncbi:MAG: phosphopantetheine-binding protein [Bacteroidota bacterium]
MQQEEIIAKLRDIIQPYVQNQEAFANIHPETDLLKDLEINSSHIVDIVLDTEDAFNIEISDEDAEQMLTVQAAVAVVQKLLQK